jgi:hypothetical protein
MSTTTTPNSQKLEASAVKSRLTVARALALGLHMIKPETPVKPAYTTRCPWCGAISLSLWWPGFGKSVIATCKKDKGGKCGGGDGNRTYSPFDLIAKVKGWDVLADFHTKVLPLADQIGRGASQANASAPESPPQKPVAAPPEP